MNLLKSAVNNTFKKLIVSVTTVFLLHKFKVTFFIFIVACLFVFFFRLDEPSIRMWDESRLAVNALEMVINKSFIVTFFDKKPDMWNTKPPLLIWFIALSMKTFGFNEFALRLPSALCGITTTVILVLFCKNYFSNLKAGVFSGFVLITSLGFVGGHVARSGDYDAMLVLWVLVYSLSFFCYLHSGKLKQNLYLMAVTVALILAVWTKGIAGVLCFPGLLLYTTWQKKLSKMLRSRELYIAATFFLVLSVGYYLLRDYYNPGYIKAVIEHELVNRYFSTAESNYRGFLYYYKSLVEFRFIPWIYLLPICFVVTQLSKNKLIKNFGLFGAMYVFCYFLVISFAKTKLSWYDAPLYPISSLIIGVGVSEGFDIIMNYYQIYDQFKRLGVLFLLFICVFFIPYFELAYFKLYKQDKIMYLDNADVESQLVYGDYLKQIINTKPELRSFYIVNNDYNAQLLFYTKVANLNHYSVRVSSPNQTFNTGDTVVTCNSRFRERLKQRYNLKLLHSDNYCYTFKID